jgi:hypothetical protein
METEPIPDPYTHRADKTAKWIIRPPDGYRVPAQALVCFGMDCGMLPKIEIVLEYEVVRRGN